MKYKKEQIESHFKWAANNEAPMTNKWIDWCAESMFIIQELLEELNIQEYRDAKCQRTHLEYIPQLEEENAKLKKQLEGACEALHKISKCEADTLQGCDVEAREALAEIKRMVGVE